MLPVVTPKIVGHDARLDEYCFLDTQGPTRVCFWGMSFEVMFDQPLYVCKMNGTMCDPSGATVPIGDISRLPTSPAYSHSTKQRSILSKVAGELYPLHIATAGAFRLDCAQPNFDGIKALEPFWVLRGNPPSAPVNMLLRNSNDTLHSRLEKEMTLDVTCDELNLTAVRKELAELYSVPIGLIELSNPCAIARRRKLQSSGGSNTAGGPVACTYEQHSMLCSEALAHREAYASAEGCDYWQTMGWDCSGCSSCPGGWISDGGAGSGDFGSGSGVGSGDLIGSDGAGSGSGLAITITIKSIGDDSTATPLDLDTVVTTASAINDAALGSSLGTALGATVTVSSTAPLKTGKGVAQPEITSMHGEGIFEDGTAKCAEIMDILMVNAGMGRFNASTLTDSCTNQPDFTMAPLMEPCPFPPALCGKLTDPYQSEAGFLDFFCGMHPDGDGRELRSFFCLSGKTVWSWKESVPYTFVTAPTSDSMFEYVIMRSSTSQLEL